MTAYVVITPVRNEELYIRKTLDAVLAQTVLPAEWVIVDDGSTDRTRDIVREAAAAHAFIKLVELPDRGYYLPGKGVVETFYKGFERLGVTGYEFIVKLDADLSFAPDYFETIFTRFADNPRLGIASGRAVTVTEGGLVPEKVRPDHPMGASKVYRRACYEDIGGIRAMPGWDTADVLRAQMRGWETRCFSEYPLMHYRQTGTRHKGITKGRYNLGRMQYRFGYSFGYNLIKALYKCAERPYIIGGLGIICGYAASLIGRDERYFDDEMVEFLRHKQRGYLVDTLSSWRVSLWGTRPKYQ